MSPASHPRARLRIGVFALAVAMGLGTPGMATVPLRSFSTDLTPTAEEVTPREAWKLAEAYVAANPGTEILVGSGESMLPLYRDRTVLVVQPMAMSELRQGMTVVYIGDRGRPVAHTLIGKTPRGWIAQGAGNREPDRTPVQFRNYIGTVIKAYTPGI